MHDLTAFLENVDVLGLMARLRPEAMDSLMSILRNASDDGDVLSQHAVDSLVFKERLSLHLSGTYTVPVIEMRLDIYVAAQEEYLGHYRYLVDTGFSFVDQFLVKA